MADSSQARRIQGEQVRCHECSNIWPRQHGGLECPRCNSEFVEIMSDSAPPSPDILPQNLPSGSSNGPALNRSTSLDSFQHHNPWRDAPDSEEDDMAALSHGGSGGGRGQQPATYHWETTNPNGTSSVRFSVFSNGGGATRVTSHGRIGGPQQGDLAVGEIERDFRDLIHTLMGITSPRHQDPPPPGRGPMPGARSLPGFLPGFLAQQQPHYHHQHQQPPRHQGPSLGQPSGPFSALFNSFLPAMGGGAPPAHPAAPEGGLFSMLRALMDPANASHGDAVFTQEALDRVVTQLMEQNQGSNAAGPASDTAIGALPKTQVSKSMLDEKGNGECSICMESVALGETVTSLPCMHWFHQACITAWLKEHDTCPHCRKGITPQPGQATGNGEGSNPSSSSSLPQQARPSSRSPHQRTVTNTMPGSWQSSSHSRSGTARNPVIVDDDNPSNHRHHRHHHHSRSRSRTHITSRHQSEPLQPTHSGFGSPTSPPSQDSRRRSRHQQPHRHSNSSSSSFSSPNTGPASGSGSGGSSSGRRLGDWVRSFGRNW